MADLLSWCPIHWMPHARRIGIIGRMHRLLTKNHSPEPSRGPPDVGKGEGVSPRYAGHVATDDSLQPDPVQLPCLREIRREQVARRVQVVEVNHLGHRVDVARRADHRHHAEAGALALDRAGVGAAA